MARLHRKIYGIQCSFCVETIYKALSKVEGVKKVYVSMAHEELFVDYDPSIIDEEVIEETLESLGYRFEEHVMERELREEKYKLIISSLISLYIGFSMLLMWLDIYIPYNQIIVSILAVSNFVLLGYKYIVMAFNVMRNGILNQHVLMFITAVSGVLGGLLGFIIDVNLFPPIEFFGVASFVTTYHILGGYTGGYVSKKSREAIEKIKRLSPNKVKIMRDGELLEIPINDVRKGDYVLIEAGERVPVDGVIVEGFSSFDESHVTGESIPVDKSVNDEVISGSLNLENPVVIKALRVSGERFLDKVVEYIKLSRAAKPNILRLLDRVLKYYVPFVILTGLSSLVIWSIYMYLMVGSPDFSIGLYVLLTVYVMGYPCALGMASPLALIMGNSLAVSRGFLFKSGEVIEVIPKVDYVVLDKTGTLTYGKPRVVKMFSYVDDKYILNIIGCAESYSNHPIARSILEYSLDMLGELECGILSNIEYFKGEGIKAEYNGMLVLVGNQRILKRFNVEAKEAPVDKPSASKIYVALDGEVVGILYIEDGIREESHHVVSELKKRGYRVSVISGDDHRVVANICKILDIDECRGNMLPWEKTDYISHLQSMGYKVAMVGDGINDGPALSKADVGIAIGSGSDIAIDSADVVIMSERIDRILQVLDLGKKIYNKIRSNLVLAFLFNGLGIPLAALGLIRPVHAMIAMVASVSTVLMNSIVFRD